MRKKEATVGAGTFTLDWLVIGLGQAGGKIAGEFHQRGYRALALNTAVADLRALDAGSMTANPSIPEERRLNISISGYDGAGGDPAFGRTCVESHAGRILNAIAQHAEGADMILLTAGLGGGTGSAVAHLAQLLSTQSLPVIALATLPMRGENAIVKVNAVKAVGELTKAPLSSLMLIDNARADTLAQGASMAEYYTQVNRAIVEPLDNLNRLNARDELHSLRSFDGEELRKLLLTGGILNYNAIELEELSLESLNNTVHQCLSQGRLMPPGFDEQNISYLALILEASATTLSNVPMAMIDAFHQHWKQVTQGAAIEVGIYSNRDHGAPTRLRLLATSAALPTEIQSLVGEASQEAATVRHKLGQQVTGIDLSALDGMEVMPRIHRGHGIASHSRVEREDLAPPAHAHVSASTASSAAAMMSEVSEGNNLREEAKRISSPLPRRPLKRPSILDEERPVHASATVTEALSMDESGIDITDDEGIETVDSDFDMTIAGSQSSTLSSYPPPLPPAAEGERISSPENYDALAYEYQATDQEQRRSEIVRQLEQDRCSEHAFVRYYAVQTMAKINPRQFESALFAATEDENDSVRKLAAHALRY